MKLRTTFRPCLKAGPASACEADGQTGLGCDHLPPGGGDVVPKAGLQLLLPIRQWAAGAAAPRRTCSKALRGECSWVRRNKWLPAQDQ